MIDGTLRMWVAGGDARRLAGSGVIHDVVVSIGDDQVDCVRTCVRLQLPAGELFASVQFESI
jgi:hypothetical protein